jgi:hypothetical protein
MVYVGEMREAKLFCGAQPADRSDRCGSGFRCDGPLGGDEGA